MLVPGRIKSVPEDFVVEELPAYEPSGEGNHLYLRFTKRNLTTDVAVRAIAEALAVRARDVGVAGMKDKVAVTTQTISVEIPREQQSGDAFAARAAALAIDGVVIHEARRHTNKLRTGHLAGNRFTLLVRGIPKNGLESARERLAQIAREGLPNAFGAQRFGRAGDNAERAKKWLAGEEQGPRDPRMKRLLWSSLQSAAFNALLDARVANGTWATPVLGDILKKRDTGGLFVCTDVQADRERATAGEVSPTGPIVGIKMRAAEGEAAVLEGEILAKILGEGFNLAATKPLGEGTRRVLRLWVENMHTEAVVETDSGEQDVSIRVNFVLPKGAYATTVLGAAFQLQDGLQSAGSGPGSGPEEPSEEPDVE